MKLLGIGDKFAMGTVLDIRRWGVMVESRGLIIEYSLLEVERMLKV